MRRISFTVGFFSSFIGVFVYADAPPPKPTVGQPVQPAQTEPDTSAAANNGAQTAAALQNSGADAPKKTPTSPFYNGEKLHIYDMVGGYINDSDKDQDAVCSLPSANVTVVTVADTPEKDGNGNWHLRTTVAGEDKSKTPATGSTKKQYANCDPTQYVQLGYTYDIYSDVLASTRYTSRSIVTGILAVPYKFHLTDHSSTVGATIGGYIGYQKAFANLFTITPVVSLGLALVPTTAASAQSTPAASNPAALVHAAAQPSAASTNTTASAPTSSNQTSTGVSVATGFIGSASNKGSTGLQYGFLLGIDWLGKKANYAYEGKPWLAFEIGYNFSQASK